MNFIELFLVGVGLSMDAFAVAICKGLAMPTIRKKDTFIIALFFGGFQALMPFVGWAVGKQFAKYITSVDHWIVFILLVAIGGKMIMEALDKNADSCPVVSLDLKELFVLAVATSIDALAVGITFAFLKVNIAFAITIIGCTTFCFSVAGVFVGHIFGSRYKRRAELAGGIILVLIGVKILLEHLGIIVF